LKKVAIIQSNYIPWKGYFDIIHDVDVFVFYDDVQYTKNDWRNRNKIKTDKGGSWITIPVGKHIDRMINEVEIRDDTWQEKHWTVIKAYYSKTPYFEQYQDFFKGVYLESKWTNLSKLNHFLIEKISKDYLGIQTEFRDSREYYAQGEKLERLIDLLIKVEATSYLSGPIARGYIDEKRFRDIGIELIFKDYSGYPEYMQLFPPFEHSVSILDLIFNCGPAAPDYIWGWRENRK
jgi:hypothetical protein